MRRLGLGTLRRFDEDSFPPSTMSAGDRACLFSVLGTLISKSVTIDANNETKSYNLFQVTNVVEVLELFGVVTTTLSDGLTACHFELYDGAAALDLTKNDGDISQLVDGSFVGKTLAAASTMAILDAADGYFDEGGSVQRNFRPFIAGQKNGQSTYIRFTVTKDAGAASGALDFFVRYHCKSNGGGVVAAA